jgi:hypothetical protein
MIRIAFILYEPKAQIMPTGKSCPQGNSCTNVQFIDFIFDEIIIPHPFPLDNPPNLWYTLKEQAFFY